MKNLVTVVVLMFALSVNAQETSITGCFGLTFGCNKQAVKDMMKAKHPDAVLERDNPNFLAYSGGKWIGHSASIWAFSFTEDGQLHTGGVSLSPVIDWMVFDLYDEVVNEMTNKYGTGNNVESWRYPYTADDKKDHGVTAVKLGKATFANYWTFAAPEAGNDEQKNTIAVTINTFVKVNIKYQSGSLIDKAVKEETKKNSSEL